MADEDRPFLAEYAKSGRASCKLCRGAIAKDTLRLAKMVQSKLFDGKQANWFHFACFYKSSIIRSPNEVSGFGSLRWEDQEKIRKKMPSVGGDSVDGPAPPPKGKRKTTRSDLKVELAKSNRSTCKGCNSQIDKDELRIAKMLEPEADKGKFMGLIPSWHHVDCFLDALKSLDAVGVGPEELSGFTKLKPEVKEELKEKFISKVGHIKTGKKRKGKDKDEDTPLPDVKKQKKESPEEKVIKEQSKLMWKYRDELQNSLSKSEMHQLLETNHQSVPKGEAKILDRLADGMTFGALKPCPECGGQLIIRSHAYQCSGNATAWSKCMYISDNPERGKWVVPKDMKEIPFLGNFKFKGQQRVFIKECTSSSQDVTDGPGPSQSLSSSSGHGSKIKEPLKGFKVYVIGRLSQSKPVLTRQIESLGGKVVSKVNENTTICISNESELEKMNKKMVEVKECDVPVVGVDYLESAGEGAALLKIPGCTISEWGAPRHSLPVQDESEIGLKSFKSRGPSKVKLTVKGVSAVDPDSELGDSHHVLEEGKTIWNAVLGMVDITRGTNSFYKLQLLEGDHSRSFYVFRSWGRVGTTIGGTKSEFFGASLSAAKDSFESLYKDKTGNYWGDASSGKVPGKFYPLEINYGQDEGVATTLGATAGSSSKLVPQIQDLIRMIFDVESMKKAMLEFEIDMQKMPLGKLSRRQMQDAYSVLSELQREINGNRNPGKILDGSNRFYTLIPHDFGMRKPPLLDTEEIIKVKTQMVDNLLEIEVAYSMLKEESGGGGGGAKDPLDVHYEQLKTDMEVLPKDSEEFGRLQEYIRNTHGATHTQYELELLEVFKVRRHGEDKRFKVHSKLHNRQLLWHGSRTTNFCGILSQGLRIAPPEAPVTGYMFGKGVYFADMVTKSANYCRTTKSDSKGLMLLCEVALGDMYELTHSKYVEKLPAGKHSTKGIGKTAPDPTSSYTTEEGVVIPMGKGMQTDITNSSLLYNEFIVYDVNQIKMHYLVKLDFKFKY